MHKTNIKMTTLHQQVPPRHWVFAVLGWTGTTFFERTIRSYVDGKFTDATCNNIEHICGNAVSKPNRYREKDPKFRIQWKLNNKMLAKVKMCGSKCLEIVNDGAMPGRPDFNTEEELFKFLRLSTLLRMSVRCDLAEFGCCFTF